MKERFKQDGEEFRKELRKSRDEQQQLWETTEFLAKLLAVGLVFRAILYFNPDTLFLQEQLAGTIHYLLELAGYSFELQGALIVGSPDSYYITRDCLGWKSMSAFVALVFASADSWRQEIKFMAAGALFIALLNIIRVLSTIVLSEAGIISFEIIHSFLWKWGMTLAVLALWYLWFTGLFDGKIQGIFK